MGASILELASSRALPFSLALSCSPRPSVDLHFGISLSLALRESGSTQFAVRMPSSGFPLLSSRTPFTFQPLWILLLRGNGYARLGEQHTR